MVVLLTVGLPVTLKEVPRADLLLTVCAHKVLGVPCAPHGRHHLDGQNDSDSVEITPEVCNEEASSLSLHWLKCLYINRLYITLLTLN